MREVGESEYSSLYSHMKRDFPANELPPFSAVLRNFRTRAYDGFFIMDSGEEAGYAIVSAPEGSEYALLLYFAMLPEKRGHGCGSKSLEIICRHYAGRSMVLEAENPDAAPESSEYRETAVRRIRFYERAGFRTLPVTRAKIFGVDMIIMANSSQNPESVKLLLHTLYLPTFASATMLRNIDIID